MRNTCPGVRTADQFSSGATTTSCTTLFSTMASLQAAAAGAANNRRPCDLEVRLQTLCRLQTKFHRVTARLRQAPRLHPEKYPGSCSQRAPNRAKVTCAKSANLPRVVCGARDYPHLIVLLMGSDGGRSGAGRRAAGGGRLLGSFHTD